jgi:molybdopterin converting factor small subunit
MFISKGVCEPTHACNAAFERSTDAAPNTQRSLKSKQLRQGPEQMIVSVSFYSYFKDLTGCAAAAEKLPAGSTIADLLTTLAERFPKLAAMRKSTLVAVGVNYQALDYLLHEGDEVSLFPPVQGG